MLKIERTVLPSPEQWEIIIEGMRNPLNSWAKSDSYKTHIEDHETLETADFEFFLGEADHDLMMRLAKGGAVHAKYRRMIPVFLTINAPLYWWKEFDTYKVGTVCNSCSTMHKIHAKRFTLDDFSHEHLIGLYTPGSVDAFIEINSADHCLYSPLFILENVIIKALNQNRDNYIMASEALKNRNLTDAEQKHITAQKKFFWWQMIQLLPTSYNQKRTVMLNYEVLVNIYHSRKNHKLDEWHIFCDWIRGLPYSELITGGE